MGELLPRLLHEESYHLNGRQSASRGHRYNQLRYAHRDPRWVRPEREAPPLGLSGLHNTHPFGSQVHIACKDGI